MQFAKLRIPAGLTTGLVGAMLLVSVVFAARSD